MPLTATVAQDETTLQQKPCVSRLGSNPGAGTHWYLGRKDTGPFSWEANWDAPADRRTKPVMCVHSTRGQENAVPSPMERSQKYVAEAELCALAWKGGGTETLSLSNWGKMKAYRFFFVAAQIAVNVMSRIQLMIFPTWKMFILPMGNLYATVSTICIFLVKYILKIYHSPLPPAHR